MIWLKARAGTKCGIAWSKPACDGLLRVPGQCSAAVLCIFNGDWNAYREYRVQAEPEALRGGYAA